jgi:hypothetical protein
MRAPKLILVSKPGIKDAITRAGYPSGVSFAKRVSDKFGRPKRAHILNVIGAPGCYGIERGLAENIAATLDRPIADLFCLPDQTELPR